MIKVRAKEQFTLGDFDKIKNLERADKSRCENGRIYEGDIFECDEGMVEYLTKTNRYSVENPNRKFVEVIEVVPEEKEVKKKTTKKKK